MAANLRILQHTFAFTGIKPLLKPFAELLMEFDAISLGVGLRMFFQPHLQFVLPLFEFHRRHRITQPESDKVSRTRLPPMGKITSIAGDRRGRIKRREE